MNEEQKVDRFGCLGSTIKVATGHYFDLLDPQPADVDIQSIAAALSKICRFGGHCPRFYSVAEHCVLAAHLASESGESLSCVQAVLLHDAAEAYVGDIVKPLKNLLPEFAEIEDRVEGVIERKFQIDFAWHYKAIKRFDRAMLKREKLTMWPDDATKWVGFDAIEDIDATLRFWNPVEAEARFLKMAGSLRL